MDISLREIFRKSWVLTKQHFGFLAIFFLATGIAEVLVGQPKGGVSQLLILLVGSAIYLAGIRVMLDIVDRRDPSVDAISSAFKSYLPFLCAYFIFEVITLLGFVLLFIPGIYIAVTYGWFGYLIVEKNAGIRESFKQSAALVKGVRWKVVALFLAIFFLNILGLLALVIGVFVTLPMSMIAFTLFYRALLARTGTPPSAASTDAPAVIAPAASS